LRQVLSAGRSRKAAVVGEKRDGEGFKSKAAKPMVGGD
jgi:hypothetical protein